MNKISLSILILLSFFSLSLFGEPFNKIDQIEKEWYEGTKEELEALVDEGADTDLLFYHKVAQLIGLSDDNVVPQGVLNYPIDFGHKTYTECAKDKECFKQDPESAIFQNKNDQKILKKIRIGLKIDVIRILDDMIVNKIVDYKIIEDENKALKSFWHYFAAEATRGHNKVYEQANFEDMSMWGVIALTKMIGLRFGTLIYHHPFAAATNGWQAIRWMNRAFWHSLGYCETRDGAVTKNLSITPTNTNTNTNTNTKALPNVPFSKEFFKQVQDIMTASRTPGTFAYTYCQERRKFFKSVLNGPQTLSFLPMGIVFNTLRPQSQYPLDNFYGFTTKTLPHLNQVEKQPSNP